MSEKENANISFAFKEYEGKYLKLEIYRLGRNVPEKDRPEYFKVGNNEPMNKNELKQLANFINSFLDGA